MENTRYVKVTCPHCGTVQVFDKQKICRKMVPGVLGDKKSKPVVTCQNPKCHERFKIEEIDCRGY